MSEYEEKSPSAGAKPRKWHRLQVAGVWVYEAPRGTAKRLMAGEVKSAPEEGWKHLGMVPTDGEPVKAARVDKIANQFLYRATGGDIVALVGLGESFDCRVIREA